MYLFTLNIITMNINKLFLEGPGDDEDDEDEEDEDDEA